jgi:hypothetical protein
MFGWCAITTRQKKLIGIQTLNSADYIFLLAAGASYPMCLASPQSLNTFNGGNMRSARFTLLMGYVLYLIPPAIYAQAYSPEVDAAAVIRRGNHVEHVNGYQDAPESDLTFGEITAPPADDSHKWFISVYTISNCGPCAKLKADWETSEYLRAFAKPKDQAGSWAHLNFYNAEDDTQNFRLKNLKIKGYPCILVQPPRSRAYGDPATVVLQKTGYKSDKELAAQITAAIKAYAKKLDEKPRQSSVRPASTGGFGQMGGPPPFNVPSPNSPVPTPNTTPPLVVPGPLDPDIQPTPTPAPPDAPAPPAKTPESVMVQRPESISVVVDSEAISASEDKRYGVRKLLALLKLRHPAIEPRVITTEQAKAEFPMLDTSKSQVIMTGLGGKIISQIPQTIIDKLLEDQPELQTVGTIVKTIGAIIPTVPQLVLLGGFGAFLFWRKTRKANAAAAPSTTPASGDGNVVRQLIEELRNLKPKE